MPKNHLQAAAEGMPAPKPVERTRSIPLSPDLIRRFWIKVDQSGGADGCWPWLGKRQNGGYGVLHRGTKNNDTVYAHRVAWAIHSRSDPVGWAVCHRCDHPYCVNPSHLFLGTIADNVADMIAKGRKAPSGGYAVRGELASSAKLTAKLVLEIRRRSAAGEGSGSLANAFGVDSSTIRQIVRRETWDHVAAEVAS
jgi:hypothetical protein